MGNVYVGGKYMVQFNDLDPSQFMQKENSDKCEWALDAADQP